MSVPLFALIAAGNCCFVADPAGPCYSLRMGPIGFNAKTAATSAVENRLREQGIELPDPSQPGAEYVPFVRMGELLFLTGQLSQWNGERKFIGKVGREISLEQARQAARLCALNLVAHLRAALDGDLDRVLQCIRVGGFVNATPEFVEHSKVINGASELFLAVFGDAGRHTRVAVGVNGLPYGVAVEVEAVFAVRS
jgi:enamine deaminase RidA (YjgF/YER057c/UK114 family)